MNSEIPVKMLQDANRVALSFKSMLEPFFPPREAESGAFFHICEVLIEGAIENYGLLRGAFFSSNQRDVALGCRNLLEIRIFTKYCLASKENAKVFADDRLIDHRDLLEALRSVELDLNPSNVQSQFDSRIIAAKDKMRSEGLERTKFKSTESMAKAVSLGDEFRTLNKIASKLVHPTSWWLFTADRGNDRFPEACDLLFSQGVLLLSQTYSDLKEHLGTYGLRHA